MPLVSFDENNNNKEELKEVPNNETQKKQNMEFDSQVGKALSCIEKYLFQDDTYLSLQMKSYFTDANKFLCDNDSFSPSLAQDHTLLKTQD